MPDTLKPCPFCGGKAVIQRNPEWGWAKYEVRCVDCDATFDLAFYSAEKAAEKWNRRVGEEEKG